MCDFAMDDDCRDYRKNKPQQKLYKPGSGPLRRSRYGLDSRMDSYNYNNSQKFKDRNHYGSHHSINGEDTDVEYREQVTSRNRKPEQQLYIPKSGDSCYEVDKSSSSSLRCNNSSQYNNRQTSNKQDNYCTGSSGFYRSTAGSDYPHKDINDYNSNRNFRHDSESRSISPGNFSVEYSSLERNRDSRSMETWAGRNKPGGGGKPPSGRRNSAGFSAVNIDNIPPRFRKKYLEKAGHQSFDNVDQLHRDQHTANELIQSGYNTGHFNSSNTNWSQTLPSRGRGRLRDNENFDREKFMNTYLKNHDLQNSRRSTPSNSYANLYEPSSIEQNHLKDKPKDVSPKKYLHSGQSNGISGSNNELQNIGNEAKISKDSEITNDIETSPQNSTNLLTLTNLDWTEEVEKNIKLDDICNTSVSFSQNINPTHHQEVKPVELRDNKKGNRSRRSDRRSSSRGHKNSERRDRNRKDSNVSLHDTERTRRDSNASNHRECVTSNLKHRDRERRDSHRSNRSSTIGNSRDDLDKWRSLRSFSREHSTERRIVSQCNSRDTSMNRETGARDSDGFRVPSATSKPSACPAVAQKKNDVWSGGRTSSVERRQHSPTASVASVDAGCEGGVGGGSSGGGRRGGSKRASRRRVRNAENLQPAANLNWREDNLESKKQTNNDRQAEGRHQRNRLNSVLSEKSLSETVTQPGLIVLPQGSKSNLQKDHGRTISDNHKKLYDYNNPTKPIIVQTSPSKHDMRLQHGGKETSGRGGGGYDANDAARAARHTALLQRVDRADTILKMHILSGPVALSASWTDVSKTRDFLQSALQKLLLSDLKFCQSDNIEQLFWKSLYYHFIETLRKSIPQASPEEKAITVKLINTIIEEGTVFFEGLVQVLEKTYKFNTDDYINDNHVLPPKGLGYVGLALISVQKLYVFLGDLSRYKEQVNETNNYGKSKLWYTKAQQINPKNGRPYNQLAILAIYARRKLDAVYYYMRSLMSSNPFQSARESLLSLFDENRKKYEAAERKRRAAAETLAAEANAATGGEESPAGAGSTGERAGDARGAGLRREVWVRPGGRRTATISHRVRDDGLDAITPVELNKNFITSYLHVNGKLITKIGMETFHESASQMLRQFRALLHRQPLPTPAARLLQLTALNMFAVETTAAAMKGNTSAERSAWLECALSVALLMFGAMLERCCALLPEPQHTQQYADALLLLPAIKVWSDWMLCHSCIWNPPPTFDNFEVDSESDPWDWLAKLMNTLEALDDKSIEFEPEMKEGYSCVRLPEDASLGGFTPLMYMEPAGAWLRADAAPPHAAEHALRMRKLLFFGTEYLVGVDPPVLRLEYPTDAQPRYVSAVQRTHATYAALQQLSEDSEDEEKDRGAASGATSLCDELPDGADEATKSLLKRKEQLESRNATMEKRRMRMQEMLGSDWVSVEVEVRPRWLVPDTNCFIDHLPLLRAVLALTDQPYQLAVPLVVVSELEGLQKCSRVGGSAREALGWLTAAGAAGGAPAGVRFATTRGSLLASCAFTAEQEEVRSSNDDRVLATALALHANLTPQRGPRGEEMRRHLRELVLLSEDRNLRVKALAADLPTRDLPSFAQWAGVVDERTIPAKTPAGTPTKSN